MKENLDLITIKTLNTNYEKSGGGGGSTLVWPASR